MFCGKEFNANSKIAKYCSKVCSNKDRGQGYMTFRCEVCNKEKKILVSKYNKSKHHYCSKECSKANLHNNYIGRNSKLYSRIIVKCKECGNIIYVNRYKYEHQSLFFCSFECKTNYQKRSQLGTNNPFYGKEHNKLTKRKISLKNKGKRAWNKGVKVPWKTDMERELDRTLYGDKYREWRNSVFKRDDYTCQICGDSSSGNLNAHHLDGYNWCKDKRVDIDNGVTLCDECHRRFHKLYGRGFNTKEQFEKFKTENA